jgi:uncharacterized protein with PIN domain
MSDRKPIFKRSVIIRLKKLLDMKYRVAELADELGVSKETVYRSYLPSGAPHERDRSGNIWIAGIAFREWAQTYIQKRKDKKISMAPGESWCMSCNKPVLMQKPTTRAINRYTKFLTGYCPECETRVNRIVSNKEKQEYQ